MKSSVDAALDKGGRGGVFYLHGEDEFRKEAAARELVAAHLDPATGDFNFDSLRGSDVGVERLASILATPPMMAEYRVVVLRETEALAASAKARDLLVGVAKSPPPGLAFILLCTVPDGSKAKLYSALASNARAFQFHAVTPNDVPGWLVDRAREVLGVEMDPDAARALGTAVGTDLGVLSQELDKLALFVGEGETITSRAVEAAGTRLPKQDRWRWFDLVGERRFAEALGSLGTLLGQGESGVGLVIGLGTHLLRLGVVTDQGVPGLRAALPRNQQWLANKLGPILENQARGWTSCHFERPLPGKPKNFQTLA